MKPLARLIGLWRGNRGWVAAGLAAVAVGGLANLALLATAGWFIAAMAAAGTSGAAFNYFTPAAVIRACAILRTGSRYAERLLTHETILRLIAPLRRRLFAALAPRAPFHLGGLHSADLAGRMMTDIDLVQRFTLRLVVPATTALTAGATALAVLVVVAPALILPVLAGLGLAGGVLPLLALRAARRAGALQVRAAARLRVSLADGVQDLPDLLLTGAAGRQARRLERLDRLAGRARLAVADLDGLGAAGSALALHLGLWLVLLAALPMMNAGQLSGPLMAGLILMLLAVAEAVAPLPAALAGWPAIRAATERVFAPMESADSAPMESADSTPMESADSAPMESADSAPPPPTAPATPLSPSATLRVRGLRLRYPGAALPALRGVDFDLPPGGRLAVVGASGSGKSSLITGLAGLLPAEAGTITADGRPFLPSPALLAVAPQSADLLSASLRHNLTLGVLDASDHDVHAACALAGLSALLATLPAGLDTAIGAGGRPLSGGEARRVCLARAWLRPAPILVLDEPGEGLDPPTEAAILHRMLNSLNKNRSLLLLTHRPTALERMDHVLVLDGGAVVEAGPPAALAARRGGAFRTFLEAAYA